MTPRRLLALALTSPVLAACADDGNDLAVAGWSAYPAASTVPADGPDATTEAADAGPTPGDAPAATTPAVVPTGVVVPVIALDNSFRPEVVEVSVGDEVRWENRGLNEHDLLYVETGEWGVEAAQFQPGDVYSRVFGEPGEYRYYCTIHGTADIGMVGTVVVIG